MSYDDDNEGQRITRSGKKKPTSKPSPENLMECAQGTRVVVVLEVGGYLAGPGDDGPTDRLCRIVDPRTGVGTKVDMYNMPRALRVACIRVEDFDVKQNKGE